MKPTKALLLQLGDLGAVPVTMIGGVPWWPGGVDRPKCSFGHFMSFVCQVRLCDVPGFAANDPGLLSFHYCQKCTEEGHGSNGWINNDDPVEATGYDVRIFEECEKVHPDGQGILAVDFMKPRRVTFVDWVEIPSYTDFMETPTMQPLLAQVEDEFINIDKNDIAKKPANQQGFAHVYASKLGGWPSWVQNPEWPEDDDAERLKLVIQLEHLEDVEYEYWCNGSVYVFLSELPGKPRAAKMTMQYT